MRNKIVAGNWKMNHDLEESEMFLEALKKQVFPENVTIKIAPAFTNLYYMCNVLKDGPIEVVAQNMHQSKNGAFTGEVSVAMLKSVGVTEVILGHSERRIIFNENNALLAEKVDTALANEMRVIFCVGENLSERKNETHFQIIEKQLKESLFHLSEIDFKKIIIAYEPVWAIGTGETASPVQAQEMHRFIRNVLSKTYSQKMADQVEILYGGSVNPGNATEIFGQPDVDGGLIGGASLKVESFMEIINSF